MPIKHFNLSQLCIIHVLYTFTVHVQYTFVYIINTCSDTCTCTVLSLYIVAMFLYNGTSKLLWTPLGTMYMYMYIVTVLIVEVSLIQGKFCTELPQLGQKQVSIFLFQRSPQ